MDPDLHLVLTAWSLEPSVILGTLALAGAYLLAAGPLRQRIAGSAPVSRLQKAWFLGGVFVLLLALISPLDVLSDDYLFSAHMLQHLLLTLAVPPMLLLGTPGWMLRFGLKGPRIHRVARWLTNPITAYVLFNLDFLIWHVPWVYEATLEMEWLHIIEHLSFIAFGVLNWWPVLSPLPELPRLSEPAQLLYLFLEAVPTSVLGGIIVFADGLLYPTYAAAPRLFGISAALDQQISGFIMWMPGGMIYLVALSLVFFGWMAREERHSHSPYQPG